MSNGATERREGFVRIALILITLTFPLFVARSQFLTGYPTYYVGLALSLVRGHGYTFMGQPHTIYPPGLPLLLAPFATIAGPNLVLINDTPDHPYYRPSEVERLAIIQKAAGSELFDLVYRFPTGAIWRVPVKLHRNTLH